MSSDLHYSISHTGDVHIIKTSEDKAFVHYVGTDKRLDEWVMLSELYSTPSTPSPSSTPSRTTRRGKRKRDGSDGTHSPDSSTTPRGSPKPNGSIPIIPIPPAVAPQVTMTEEEYDMEHHKQISAVKNFEKVHFGLWLIKTWYFF
jgi:histone acetyltransferase MYST1